MKNVTVSKARLLETLQKNRDEHRDQSSPPRRGTAPG